MGPKPPHARDNCPLNNTEAGAADLPPAPPGPASSASKTKELMMNDSAKGREPKDIGRNQDAHLSSSKPSCHHL